MTWLNLTQLRPLVLVPGSASGNLRSQIPSFESAAMKPQFDSTRPLTDSEREEFRTRDARFIRNWSSVWEAVSDLVFIQKNRLYREEFPSFEAYLKSRCNLGKSYAYQLIEAHGVIEKVKLLEVKIPRATEISNERQCRALAKVPDDRLECVVEKACELSGEKPLTAKILLQAKKLVAGQRVSSPDSIDAVSFDTIDIQPAKPDVATESGRGGNFDLKSVLEDDTEDVSENSFGERNPFAPLDPEREAQKLFNQFDYQGRLVIYETISSLWHLESGGKKPKRRTFTKPTLEEVQLYCESRGNTIDPEAFVDHYAKTGWRLPNGLQVSDWQACVRTWERRQKPDPRANPDAKIPARNSVPPVQVSKPQLRADLAARLSQPVRTGSSAALPLP